MRGLGRERKRSWKSEKEGDEGRNIYSTGVQDKISDWNERLTFYVLGEWAGRDLEDGFTTLTFYRKHGNFSSANCNILIS